MCSRERERWDRVKVGERMCVCVPVCVCLCVCVLEERGEKRDRVSMMRKKEYTLKEISLGVILGFFDRI